VLLAEIVVSSGHHVRDTRSNLLDVKEYCTAQHAYFGVNITLCDVLVNHLPQSIDVGRLGPPSNFEKIGDLEFQNGNGQNG
jgi:hypothetical protein